MSRVTNDNASSDGLLPARSAVDQLPDDVRMPGMAGRFLDQMHEDPPEREVRSFVLTVGEGFKISFCGYAVAFSNGVLVASQDFSRRDAGIGMKVAGWELDVLAREEVLKPDCLNEGQMVYKAQEIRA